LKQCIPETIHPFLPEKAEFYKIPLAFFRHSGMLGKYFPLTGWFRFTGRNLCKLTAKF
jgi:hypothetical protein